MSASDEEEDTSAVDPDDVDLDVDMHGEGFDEDIESDEAFGEGDEDSFKKKGFVFRGSGVVKGVGETGSGDEEDVDKERDGDTHGSEDESMGSEDDFAGLSDDSGSNQDGFSADGESEMDSNSSQLDFDEKDDSNADGSDENSVTGGISSDRAELRKMMAEEQKSVVETISKAAKADASKGKAVLEQQKQFSSLLNTRIRLQKGLVAANSLPTEAQDTTDHATIEAAQQAALTLWTNLNDLRSSLQTPSMPTTSKSKKRPFEATLSTSSSDLWSEMQSHELSTMPHRRTILTKWSARTAAPTTLPSRNKLINTTKQHSLLDVLDNHLSGPNMDSLIQKSRSDPQSPSTYDDTALYTLLLRDLVAQKSSQSSLPSSTGATLPILPLRPPKQHRANVNQKASKGRKLRYTVHEKLLNFMAPEDRTTWGEERVREFVGGLLGRKVNGVLREEDGESGSEEDGEAGLRLFGTAA